MEDKLLRFTRLPSDRPFRIAFVGCVIPKKSCDVEPACSIAANNYQHGLLNGLEAISGQAVHIISTWTIAMYPRSASIIQPARHIPIGTLSPATFVPFLNVPILKQLTMLLSLFLYLAHWLLLERHAAKRIVLLYGTFSPYSLAVLGATAIFGGIPVAIVTELPFDRQRQRGCRRLLQRLDFKVQTYVIRRFQALVPMTRQLVEDYAPASPALVVEGAIDVKLLPAHRQPTTTIGTSEHGTGVVLYSGAIDSINGIPLLLSAFDLITDPAIELHIFGQGPLEERVCESSKRNPRIVYGGFVPNDEILWRQASATCLVLPRPTSQRITRYSFPSKVLEYMASGRPTIATRLIGIPSEYNRYLYFLNDETPNGLARLIEDVLSMDAESLRHFGECAKEFVTTHKNWSSQARRVYDFLAAL